MSNNYNNGYRIAAMPLPELFAFFERVRSLMTAGIREHMAKRLITDAVAIVDFFTVSGGCLSDIRFSGDDYEPDDVPLMSVYYEAVAELTGSSNPRYINKKIRPLLYTFDNIKMRPSIKDYTLFKVIFGLSPYNGVNSNEPSALLWYNQVAIPKNQGGKANGSDQSYRRQRTFKRAVYNKRKR